MLAIDEFWKLKRSIQKMARFKGITDCQFYLGALNNLRNPAAESQEDYWGDLRHDFPDLSNADAEEYLIVLLLFHHDVHVRPKGKERLEAFNQLRDGVDAPNMLEISPAKEAHYKRVLRELLGSEQHSNDWHSREGRVDAGIGCVHARQISDTLTRFATGNGTTRNPLISKLIAGNLLQVLKKARGILDAELQRGGKVTISDYERMYFNWTTLMSFRGVTICATCFPDKKQGFSALYEDELITRTGLTIKPTIRSPIKRYIIGDVPESSVNVFKQQTKNGVALRVVPRQHFDSVCSRREWSFKSFDLVLVENAVVYETAYCDHDHHVGRATLCTEKQILSEAKSFFLALDERSSDAQLEIFTKAP